MTLCDAKILFGEVFEETPDLSFPEWCAMRNKLSRVVEAGSDCEAARWIADFETDGETTTECAKRIRITYQQMQDGPACGGPEVD